MPEKMRAAWWWIDRWRKSTAYTDMTLAEQGAYRNLLDELWLRDGVLPNDERILAKICGDPWGWKKVREKVLARFILGPDGWRNETHDEVCAQYRAFTERQSEKGRKGAAARWGKRSPNDSPGSGRTDGRGNGTGIGPGIGQSDDRGQWPDDGLPSPSPSPTQNPSPEPTTTPPPPPRKRRGGTCAAVPENILCDFEVFWSRVPVKIAKGAALEEYARKRAAGVTAERILEGVAKFVAYEERRKAQSGDDYRPLHPRTWLHQARWEDELPEPAGGPGSNGAALPQRTRMTIEAGQQWLRAKEEQDARERAN